LYRSSNFGCEKKNGKKIENLVVPWKSDMVFRGLSPYAGARVATLVATKNTKKMDFAAIFDAFAGDDNKIISTFQFHH
jgi:hypothetical protein